MAYLLSELHRCSYSPLSHGFLHGRRRTTAADPVDDLAGVAPPESFDLMGEYGLLRNPYMNGAFGGAERAAISSVVRKSEPQSGFIPRLISFGIETPACLRVGSSVSPAQRVVIFG